MNRTVLTNHPSPHRFLAGILAAWLVSFSASSADEPAEWESLRSRAESGDVKARLDLAIRYRDGKGVAKDEAAAKQWAHRAADKGDAEAMDFVGHAYLRGSAIKGNAAIAFGYFKAAAMALLSGDGVAPDAAETRRLAERAAKLSDPSGLVVLGDLRAHGPGLRRSHAHDDEGATGPMIKDHNCLTSPPGLEFDCVPFATRPELESTRTS